MMHFIRIIIVISFFRYYYGTQTEKLTCDGVPALELDNFVQYNLNRISYYTKAVIQHGESQIKHPIGFVLHDKLIYTTSKIPRKRIMISYSFISESSTTMMLYKCEYVMDDTHAIFESNEDVSWKEFRRVNQSITVSPKAQNTTRPSIKFALVFIGKYNMFRIFQTCDKSLAWVQVRDLKKFLADEDEIAEVREAFRRLRINGSFIMTTKKFPIKFDYKSVILDELF